MYKALLYKILEENATLIILVLHHVIEFKRYRYRVAMNFLTGSLFHLCAQIENVLLLLIMLNNKGLLCAPTGF